MGADLHPTYALLKHDGQLCAAASFWRVPNEPIPFEGQTVYRALDAFLQRWPLLICRSPFSGTPGLILPSDSVAGRCFERDYPPRAWSAA